MSMPPIPPIPPCEWAWASFFFGASAMPASVVIIRPAIEAACCKALQSPIRQIAENAGVEGSIVVGKVMERSGSFGYDAQADEYGDMFEKGIIDPAKVVRIALEDAASIAGLMITTEAGVAEEPQKEAGGPAQNHGGMM